MSTDSRSIPDQSSVAAVALPAGIQVFQRGWLSSNNVLIQGSEHCTLIDSGYCTHAKQTQALVAHALQGRPLDVLLNTHLHSDHCGGNATLQAAHTALKTLIPPRHAHFVSDWDPYALTYVPSGHPPAPSCKCRRSCSRWREWSGPDVGRCLAVAALRRPIFYLGSTKIREITDIASAACVVSLKSVRVS